MAWGKKKNEDTGWSGEGSWNKDVPTTNVDPLTCNHKGSTSYYELFEDRQDRKGNPYRVKAKHHSCSRCTTNWTTETRV